MKVNFKPIDFNVLGTKIQESDWEAMVLGLTGGTLEPNMGANVWKSDGALHMFNQRVLSPDGKTLEGDYFSGRGRQTIGSMKLVRIGRERMSYEQAASNYLTSV